MPRPRLDIERSCERCGVKFLAKQHKVAKGLGRFCSVSCAKSTTVEAICAWCKRPFMVKPSVLAKGDGICCSKACVNQWKTGRYSIPLEERFLAHIAAPNEFGCTLWTGAKIKSGYGTIGSGHPLNITLYAHRVAWERARGTIPDGLFVLHDCDQFYPRGDVTNRACVNPEHLFLGTHDDNMLDMGTKGRCWTTKLTPDQVREIRRRYSEGGVGQVALAEEFHVSQANINDIVLGKIWVAV